ncbi:flavodoxin family protein [Geotalea uraniireducens]|uniref:NADPH-dependent FMN reductase n=1 Tax=Geotalea uraniireducens (strain Rf4) TaxID=351605 RepID=A5G7B0_GEOUR|nr:flavodoxin family protein [Geotalea uraniireducens]ABQ27678.1 NADPH-dependent FMN reductase [Geotalea uraniireducens Rf4]
MTVIGINGSPRKKWNTATLLTKALEGAVAQGAETELIHLYDLDFKGCMSCFACKTKGGKSYGTCGLNDGLTPILKKIVDADAIIIGSPIYFGSVTGETRSFLERLLFPYLTYTVPYASIAPRKIATGFIYTMNVAEEQSKVFGYEYLFNSHARYLQLIFGQQAESLCSFDTCQFNDYSKVLMESFDPVHKAQRREEVFPLDCKRAYELGARLAGKRSE